MNYLFQRADNINENERKNDLVKPWVDQVLEGGGGTLCKCQRPRRFLEPRGFLGPHVFRNVDRTASFWRNISHNVAERRVPEF